MSKHKTPRSHRRLLMMDRMVARKPVRSWRQHTMVWVLGCIDAQGAIVANPSRESRTHHPEESRGKRWRWCVWSQEFIFAGPATLAEVNQPPDPLSDEENFAVCDWLIRHGYADERCLPEVLPQPQPPP